MKKFFYCTFTPLVLICTFLAGCTDRSLIAADSDAWILTEVKRIESVQWPKNEYTAQIVKPQSGELDYICDYSDSGRYLVMMKDMAQEASATYVADLEKQGYLPVSAEENSVSVGTILQKGSVTLSVAYSGDMLGILITIQDGI